MSIRYPGLQQQWKPPTATSPYDCTAAMAGLLGDADSRGKLVYTHNQVRQYSGEPTPNHDSPGLNWSQVDVALLHLSSARINLDVRSIGTPFTTLQTNVRNGRWAGIATWRRVLVQAGLGGSSSFARGHACAIGYDADRAKAGKAPVALADPLVPYWQWTTWDVVKKACAAFVTSIGRQGGGAYFALTRDLVDAVQLRYSVVLEPGRFFVYNLNANGVITGRATHDAFTHQTSAPCSAPVAYSWPGHGTRKLVRVTKGSLDGEHLEPGTTNVTLKVVKA